MDLHFDCAIFMGGDFSGLGGNYIFNTSTSLLRVSLNILDWYHQLQSVIGTGVERQGSHIYSPNVTFNHVEWHCPSTLWNVIKKTNVGSPVRPAGQNVTGILVFLASGRVAISITTCRKIKMVVDDRLTQVMLALFHLLCQGMLTFSDRHLVLKMAFWKCWKTHFIHPWDPHPTPTPWKAGWGVKGRRVVPPYTSICDKVGAWSHHRWVGYHPHRPISKFLLLTGGNIKKHEQYVDVCWRDCCSYVLIILKHINFLQWTFTISWFNEYCPIFHKCPMFNKLSFVTSASVSHNTFSSKSYSKSFAMK